MDSGEDGVGVTSVVDTTEVRKQWVANRTKPQDIERFAYQWVNRLLDRIDELEQQVKRVMTQEKTDG